MSSLIPYKLGLNVLSPEPTGAGGIGLNDTIRTTADLIEALQTAVADIDLSPYVLTTTLTTALALKANLTDLGTAAGYDIGEDALQIPVLQLGGKLRVSTIPALAISNITGLQAALDATASTTALTSHTSNTSNPHAVTKTQVGLSNVTNALQLVAASNLSDVVSVSTARTNLGLGTAATRDTGTSNGNVPLLDSNGKLSIGVLPGVALNDTFVVASQAAMLALTAETGDIAVRTDQSKSYILKGASSSTLADWQELLTPTDLVQSVNGMTGTVTLTTSNITEGSNLYYTTGRVNTDAPNVTIGTANGLSLVAQALSLALASGSTAGAMSAAHYTLVNNATAALSASTLVKRNASGAATLDLVGYQATGNRGDSSTSLSITAYDGAPNDGSVSTGDDHAGDGGGIYLQAGIGGDGLSFALPNGANGAVIINDAGKDTDLRVEGDTDQNLFFIDASTDRVSIGNNAPTTKLDVSGTITATLFSGPLAASDITGTLPVGHGGTGVTSFGGTNRLLYTSSTNTLTSITTANSSVLITSGSGVPSWSTTLPAINISAGTNVTAANIVGTNTLPAGVLPTTVMLTNATSTLSDAVNIAVGTTTGTKIGTSTSQKLGFFNATPVVQPSSTTDLRSALINLGLYASGGATPLDLNGGTITAVGSGLTSLNGTNISSGTVADARLSSNVPLKNASATITGAYTFSGQFLTITGTGYPSSGLTVQATGSGAAYAHFVAADATFFDFGKNNGGDAYFYTPNAVDLNFYTNNNVRLTVQSGGDVVAANGLTVGTKVTTPHVVGSGSTPTYTAGAGAGTGPTISIAGKDTAGTITVTTGTSPSASSDVVTVNFATAFASAPVVVFSGANSLTVNLRSYVTSTTTGFTLSTTTALSAGSTFAFNYHVIG